MGEKVADMSDETATHDQPPSANSGDAAAWFVRTRGRMSEQEERAFLAWLTADSDHARAYDAVTAAWNACLALYEDRELLVMRLKALTAVSGNRRLCGEGTEPSRS